METSSGTYLHKKFKKQLTVEQKPVGGVDNAKENKDTARVVGSSEEKNTSNNPENCLNQNIADNNQVNVPNRNTNFENVLNAVNLSKSSISTETCSGNMQSFNSSISFITNQQDYHEKYKPLSFDKILLINSHSPDTKSNYNHLSSFPDEYFYNRHHSESIKSYRHDGESYRHSSELTESYRRESESTEQDIIEDQPEDYSNREDFEAKTPDLQPLPDKNGNGKYVCNYCNLVCSKPSVLQKHIRAHTNERPYPCTSCGFSFKTRSNLYKHCRSRAHANRVKGNKSQSEADSESNRLSYSDNYTSEELLEGTDSYNKPYKPRFHNPVQLRENELKENYEEEEKSPPVIHSDLTHHINEIISKNNSIVNSADSALLKKRMSDVGLDSPNNNECSPRLLRIEVPHSPSPKADEPLNLSNKNRKRSMSEATEPLIQKSLIKELLLKNLNASDLQCAYCKMIFQTVTELDIHKIRTCKGKPSEVKYTRSSSVNVASILTKDRHAFDNIPQLQNTISFPLNSPGPFLGKTRLVDGDKSKSFSFDTGQLPLLSPASEKSPNNYLLSPLSFEKEKRPTVKLFGGEVKVQNSSGETKSYRIDNKDDKFEQASNLVDFGSKVSESRVLKSGFQSGGTVLTNKSTYRKEDARIPNDVISIYENKIFSPNLFKAGNFTFERQNSDSQSRVSKLGESSSISENVLSQFSFKDMANFSQHAVKQLTPNIKQPFISLSNTLMGATTLGSLNNMTLLNSQKIKVEAPKSPRIKESLETTAVPDVSFKQNSPYSSELESRQLLNSKNNTSPSVAPTNLYVNGKIVRHVPGIPGPVVVEGMQPDLPPPGIIPVPKTSQREIRSPVPPRSPFSSEKISFPPRLSLNSPLSATQKVVDWMQKSPKPISLEEKSKSELKPPIKIPEIKSPTKETSTKFSSDLSEPKKFIRPNSLALKPTPAFSKQQHGLTPTILNQILISPDTPRVAKKYAQHFLNGNYFSYLGLKSTTKLVYCTLNKTQPFYVPHFKRLSMYSEWRQQDNRIDKLFASRYDSRQRRAKYSIAGKATADLIIHSSYKFIVTEMPASKQEDDSQKKFLIGGYECNEDYPYIRGRGRGKYVCEQCGIRCKKPSMLKKHIRTHSDDRPYTCSQCNFSFKTKGNLTKHMKSKSHTKNISTTSGESSFSAQHSGSTLSSDSEDEDSGMDSSDESVTRKEEHEAAYGLLSLSQKPTTTGFATPMSEVLTPGSIIRSSSPTSDTFISNEEVAHVSNANYARNKIMDNRAVTINFSSISESGIVTSTANINKHSDILDNYLGKSSATRPLTYPYTNALINKPVDRLPSPGVNETSNKISQNVPCSPEKDPECKIKNFHVIKKYASTPDPPKIIIEKNTVLRKPEGVGYKVPEVPETYQVRPTPVPLLKVNNVTIKDQESVDRKRKMPYTTEYNTQPKVQRNEEVMDLSVTTNNKTNGLINKNMVIETSNRTLEQFKTPTTTNFLSVKNFLPGHQDPGQLNQNIIQKNQRNNEACKEEIGPVVLLKPFSPTPQEDEIHQNSDYDNSAMETLADVATKQVKLEKNTLAKSVASEYLKLATQNENVEEMVMTQDVNDLMVKSEGSKNCTICSKSFSKPSQLRLHMNIHYLERPFRCDSCSVSFRTKGHLQKHERSASHYSKLSTSPAQSSAEPRPFKCQDCRIAFRIHGHLAKHLRSKLHIMKLECLSKIPFGLYAELERSNSLLTEINTSDADQCLESLKTLAEKVFLGEPEKIQDPPLHGDFRGNINSDSL